MNKTIFTIILLFISHIIVAQTDSFDVNKLTKSDSKVKQNPILMAEELADSIGKKILKTARIMTLEEKVIVRGSCWNYVNTVFKRAGFAKKRHIVYKSKKKGPYVNSDLIKAGDWIYYVNHSYGDIEHSGIFVYWIDKSTKTASILSYGGERRNEPARYKPYKIDNVYFINRAGKK